MTAAEAAMTQYRESQNALSLEDRQNIVVSRLNTLNETVTKARTMRLQKEGSTRRSRRSIRPATPPMRSRRSPATPGSTEAKGRLAELVADRARLSARYQPGHPEMHKLAGQIENSRAALRAQRASVIEAARNEYESALIEERSLRRQLEGQKGAAMDLDRKSGGYQVLQREAESNRARVSVAAAAGEGAAGRQQQPSQQRAADGSRRSAGAPFSPNARRDWFTALLAGLLVAFGLAFGIEYLDDTVKTPEDVSKRLRLPLLGLVPAVRGERVPLLSEPVPHEFGEAFRSLRTSIVFTSGDEGRASSR